MKKTDQDFVLGPNLPKILYILIICSLFILIGFLMWMSGEFMGLVGIMFFSLGFIVFIPSILLNRNYILLSPQGLTIQHLLFRRFFHWEDILQIKGYKIPLAYEVVSLNLSPDTKENKFGGIDKTFTRSMTGHDYNIIGMYNTHGKKLIDILSYYHNKYKE